MCIHYNNHSEVKIKNFYDEKGKLISYPAKRPLRELVLNAIADMFEYNCKYSEKEVNEIIKRSILFSDVELIRRELYDYRLLDRLKDGSVYWREKTK